MGNSLQNLKFLFIFPIKFIVIILLVVIIYTPALLITLLNEICRIFVAVLLKIHYGTQISIVSEGANNVWDFKKSGNWRTVTRLRIYHEPADLTQIRDYFCRNVLERTEDNGSTKTFAALKKTRVQKFGYFCVRDDSRVFDIEKHIKVYDLSKPVDDRHFFSEEEFFKTIMSNLTQDMDESKPQWEDIIIHRVKFNDREQLVTVQCFRWHHGIMDGLTMDLMHKFCMYDCPIGHELLEPSGEKIPFNPLQSLNISLYQLFFIKFITLLKSPYVYFKTSLQIPRSKSRFFTASYSGQRHFGWTEKMHFNLLKEIRDSLDGGSANISSIMITALESAFYKMEQKFGKGNGIDLIQFSVIGVKLPYNGIAPQNRITVTSLPLLVGDANWKDRLTRISQQFRRRDPLTLMSYYSSRWIGRFPVSVVNWVLKTVGNKVQEVAFTSLSCSREELALFGQCVLTDVGGWGLLMINNGLSITAFRYADHFRFWVVSDDACLSMEEFDFCIKQIGIEIKNMVQESNTAGVTVKVESDSSL